MDDRSWPGPAISVAEICTNPMAASVATPTPLLRYWHIGGSAQKRSLTPWKRKKTDNYSQSFHEFLHDRINYMGVITLSLFTMAITWPAFVSAP